MGWKDKLNKAVDKTKEVSKSGFETAKTYSVEKSQELKTNHENNKIQKKEDKQNKKIQEQELISDTAHRAQAALQR